MLPMITLPTLEQNELVRTLEPVLAEPARAKMLHLYPTYPSVGPGSVALCGWVKRTPRGNLSHATDRCVVCWELDGSLSI